MFRWMKTKINKHEWTKVGHGITSLVPMDLSSVVMSQNEQQGALLDYRFVHKWREMFFSWKKLKDSVFLLLLSPRDVSVELNVSFSHMLLLVHKIYQKVSDIIRYQTPSGSNRLWAELHFRPGFLPMFSAVLTELKCFTFWRRSC